jgi:hypothetical protein
MMNDLERAEFDEIINQILPQLAKLVDLLLKVQSGSVEEIVKCGDKWVTRAPLNDHRPMACFSRIIESITELRTLVDKTNEDDVDNSFEAYMAGGPWLSLGAGSPDAQPSYVLDYLNKNSDP